MRNLFRAESAPVISHIRMRFPLYAYDMEFLNSRIQTARTNCKESQAGELRIMLLRALVAH